MAIFKRSKKKTAPAPARVITDQTQLSKQDIRDLMYDARRVMRQHGQPGKVNTFISVGAILHGNDKHEPQNNRVAIPYKAAKKMTNTQRGSKFHR